MAYAELHHLQDVLLGEEDRLFSLSDLQQVQGDVSSLLIELPQRDLGGDLPSPSELAAIIAHAKAKDMKLHLDGARLWECQPFFGQSYEEIVRDFDSLYVSFYKILGGLPGAALVGPADFIAEARIWMRRHGGNLHLMAPNAISAKQGMDHHLPKIPDYVAKAQELAAALQGLPGLTVLPSHPKVNMFHLKFEAGSQAIMEASAQIARESGCLLLRYVSDDGPARTAEIIIGEAALNLQSSQVRSLFESLLALTYP
jgi:threonine aldolase